jgi:hypothetical protein
MPMGKPEGGSTVIFLPDPGRLNSPQDSTQPPGRASACYRTTPEVDYPQAGTRKERPPLA